jgi:hypothetical protein
MSLPIEYEYEYRFTEYEYRFTEYEYDFDALDTGDEREVSKSCLFIIQQAFDEFICIKDGQIGKLFAKSN